MQSVINIVLPVAPSKGFQIQFCDGTENSAGKKVFFYKTDQAFHFPFGKRIPRLTGLSLEVINEIKQEQGENFNLDKINLAELERRTGLSRSKLRHLKENDFIVTPHGRTGQKATAAVLTGYSIIIDGLLRKGVTNSSVCFERLLEAGYISGPTSVKTYIAAYRDLIPPKRQLVALQGNRGRRYQTATGGSYQMHWQSHSIY